MKFRTAAILSILFLIIPFAFYLSIFNGSLSSNGQDWGNFGSYIGGTISSVFSFLSFLMVLIIFYQSKKEMEKREIDDRVFKYIDLLNSCYQKIEVNVLNTQEKGEAVFSKFVGASFKINKEIENDNSDNQRAQILQLITLNVFYKNSILEYFDLIKILLNYIDKKGFERKKEYISLLSSQMSEQQKIAFAITNYSTVEENKAFRDYVYNNVPIDGYIKIGKTIDHYMN